MLAPRPLAPSASPKRPRATADARRSPLLSITSPFVTTPTSQSRPEPPHCSIKLRPRIQNGSALQEEPSRGFLALSVRCCRVCPKQALRCRHSFLDHLPNPCASLAEPIALTTGSGVWTNVIPECRLQGRVTGKPRLSLCPAPGERRAGKTTSLPCHVSWRLFLVGQHSAVPQSGEESDAAQRQGRKPHRDGRKVTPKDTELSAAETVLSATVVERSVDAAEHCLRTSGAQETSAEDWKEEQKESQEEEEGHGSIQSKGRRFHPLLETILVWAATCATSLNALPCGADRQGSWSVPWTGDTTFQVMFLWFLSFWFIGSWLIPVVFQLVGLHRSAMSQRAQALYSLSTDLAEMAVGLSILNSCRAGFRPLSADWFRLRPRGRWFIDIFFACCLFPVVQLLSRINTSLLPIGLKLPPAVRVEQSINTQDPLATLIYATTVAFCAPVWEEMVFRGFLLPSLTRYLPLWGAILASAAVFSLAHFSLQRLLPLFFLGIVLGVVFARSQNLLTSIILHSLWNCFVFLDMLI